MGNGHSIQSTPGQLSWENAFTISVLPQRIWIWYLFLDTMLGIWQTVARSCAINNKDACRRAGVQTTLECFTKRDTPLLNMVG